MEIYDISIEPGQVRDIFVNGSYVYFYSGSAGGADATITVNQDSRGQRVLLMPGQAYRMPDGQAGTRWLIGNLKGEGTIVGRLVIGAGDLTDNRVTGSVEVIDGEKVRTMAGGMFAGVPAIANTPTQFGNVQLWNPAASGKNLIVTQMAISWTSASNAVVTFENAQLSTLYEHQPSNKKAGATAPVGQLRKQSNAAVMQVFPYGILQNIEIQAGGPAIWKVSGALVLQPGYGLTVNQQTENMGIKASYEWFEEPI